MVFVLAIDPGHSRLGIAAVEIRLDQLDDSKITVPEFMRNFVTWHLYQTVSIIDLVKQCKNSECKFQHTGQVIDKINHLLYSYPQILQADYIVIESQPPMGSTDIQNLILKEFEILGLRHKIILIESQARNRYAQFGKTNRLERKQILVRNMLQVYNQAFLESEFQTACPDRPDAPLRFKDDFQGLVDEIHDRVDALFLIHMYIDEVLLHDALAEMKQAERITLQNIQTKQLESMTVHDYFQQFMFRPNLNKP